MNIITKLKEGLKSLAYQIGHGKVMKVTLAFVMSLSVAAGAVSCAVFKDPSDDSDNTVTAPSGNGSTTPSNPSDNKPDTTPSAPDDPIAQYSQILQNVLKSSYYQEVINHYRDTATRSDYYGEYQPNPYKLLEDLGININRIKNNELFADSTAYIKGDDTSKLYVTTKIENKSPTQYYDCVTACYKLTKKEYEDLEMLHAKSYIQGPLFIQELSYEKDPISYTYSKIAISSYNSLQKRFATSPNLSTNVFGTNNIVLDFNCFSLKDNTFEVSIRTIKHKNGLIGEGQICVVLLSPNIIDMTTLSYDETIFTGPTQNFSGSLEDYKNSREDITYFDMGFDINLATYLIK